MYILSFLGPTYKKNYAEYVVVGFNKMCYFWIANNTL